VRDITAPVIATLPVTSTIDCPDVPLFETAAATDACDPTVTLGFMDVTTAGTCSDAYSVTRTWTATDNCGNSSTASQTINVIAPPVTLTCQQDTIVAMCTSQAVINAKYTAWLEGALVSGGCNTALTHTNPPAPPATGGSVMVTWTATSNCQPNVMCSATFTVTTDNVPPTGPATIPGAVGYDGCYAAASFLLPFNAIAMAANYTDNCGGPLTATLTNTMLTGNNCSWTLKYTFMISDESGNMLTGRTITHTGADYTAPTGTQPPPSTGNSGCMDDAVTTYPFNPVSAAAGYVDNCGAFVMATLTSTSLYGIDCNWTIVYTFSVYDECNNLLTGQQQVIMGSDQTPPSFTRPADILIYADQDCMYDADVSVTGDVLDEDDNCASGLEATYVDNVVAGPCACSYIITRTWSLVDACTNAAPNQVQTITVHSNIVTNTNDSGPGSLREVIDCAVEGSTITFASWLMNTTIGLTTGEIVINKHLTLAGLGVNSLTVSGSNASRIFTVATTRNVAIRNMALKNASSLTAGGAVKVQGNLTLENILLQSNLENGLPKSLTMMPGGQLIIDGNVDMKN